MGIEGSVQTPHCFDGRHGKPIHWKSTKKGGEKVEWLQYRGRLLKKAFETGEEKKGQDERLT